MKITIVIFKAFDRVNTEVFYKNETAEQMHLYLSDICDTYDPICIYQTDEAEQISLNFLNRFKTTSHV